MTECCLFTWVVKIREMWGLACTEERVVCVRAEDILPLLPGAHARLPDRAASKDIPPAALPRRPFSPIPDY